MYLLLLSCVGSRWQQLRLLGLTLTKPACCSQYHTAQAACQLQDTCHSPHP
jgi:hypothetical protein